MIQDISAGLVSIINMLQPEMIVLGYDGIDWPEDYVKKLEVLINDRKDRTGWMEYSGQEGLFRQAGTAGRCGSFGSKQYFQGGITVFCVNFSFSAEDSVSGLRSVKEVKELYKKYSVK